MNESGPGVDAGTDEARLASLLTLSDVYGTGWHAAVRGGVTEGSTVTVIGDGAVGLLAVLSAKQLGAERIVLMGRHQVRTDLGREYGATDVVAERGEEGIAKCASPPEPAPQASGIDAQLAGALVEGVQRLVVALVGDPDLRLDEDLRAVEPRAADRLSGLSLVAVRRRSVDVPVADGQRGLHGRSPFTRRLPP